jgi:glyoxylase-like metal-dependent hydrolase (beta-lactamase superfamily II)
MKQLLVIVGVFLSAHAAAQAPNFDAVQIKTIKVAQNIYVLEGQGGNIGVSVGEDGVLLIDDQFAPLTAKHQEAIKPSRTSPVRFLINTHYHWDHVGGNENWGKAGVMIVAHDNVYKRMSGRQVVQILKQDISRTRKPRCRHDVQRPRDLSHQRR